MSTIEVQITCNAEQNEIINSHFDLQDSDWDLVIDVSYETTEDGLNFDFDCVKYALSENYEIDFTVLSKDILEKTLFTACSERQLENIEVTCYEDFENKQDYYHDYE